VRILAAILAGALLAGCATCKTFLFPNDADPRPVCQARYHVMMPDNTLVELPEQFSLKEFLCIADNTFCFPNDNTSLFRSQRRGDIELWRI